MIKKMEHTAIMVSDMDRSIEYYGDMFGFKVRIRKARPDRDMAFLYLDAQPDMEIELIQDLDKVVDYSNTGRVNHLAFTVENIDESIRYYKEKGINFHFNEPKPTIEGGRMILFSGPDGEVLQLVERAK